MEKLTPQIDGAYPNAQVTYDPHPIVGDAYANCRLILTPLSAISDEDAVEVAKIGGFIHEWTPEDKKGYWINYTKKKYLEKADFGRHLAVPIIDYLRSRNYDLGYMGIRSLIDAGIAISSLDKTDSNVQP